MATLTLENWYHIAQIALFVVTALGVITSMYLSVRALREVQADRHHRQRPYLAFDGGGFRYPIKFVKAGQSIPGVNPGYVAKAFPNLPADAESVRLNEPRDEDGTFTPTPIGQLRNYGLGPAIETEVTWLAKKIWIGEESFTVDDDKLQEPAYSAELNTMPSHPAHILPGHAGTLFRLPTFVDKDHDKKISRVDGLLRIKCQDVFGNSHVSRQQFHLWTNYTAEKNGPYIHITFSDLHRAATNDV